MSYCDEVETCCEYDGCLRSFLDALLDECGCYCHDWDPHYDDD